MLKRILFAIVFCVAAPAHAEFSEEWQDYAAETEEACDEFERTLPPDLGARPRADGRLKLPTIPRGAPMRPYMCMFFRFDIAADGQTENIELFHREPENLHFVFVRKAKAAIRKWRFVAPENQPEGIDGLYTRINYIPVGGRTYQIWYDIWGGE